MTAVSRNRSVLVVGASRGLGEAIVEEYVARGSAVVGTVREGAETPLHEFARSHPEAVEIERVDIAKQKEISAVRRRLAGRTFDLLFVVAGISLAPRNAIAAEIADDDFARMMSTNALGVMRTVETLQDLVNPVGTIAVMSSGQGSITNNHSGGFEIYRASKAAVNQLMRSYAARHADDRRALLLMAPGWVRTDMGGDGATFGISESIPQLVDIIDAQRGRPGLQYLDRQGDVVPW